MCGHRREGSTGEHPVFGWTQLYNLVSNIAEDPAADLAPARPELVDELTAGWMSWHALNVPKLDYPRLGEEWWTRRPPPPAPPPPWAPCPLAPEAAATCVPLTAETARQRCSCRYTWRRDCTLPVGADLRCRGA